MSTAVHTPGPWTRDKYGHVVDANGRDIQFRSLSICCAGPRESVERAEANTSLIAAAPDMLDALQEAKHMFADEYPGHPTTERIFAAIEAATQVPA